MNVFEIVITSSVSERMEVAKILVRNGYRVYAGTRKVGSVKKPVLIVDRPDGKDPSGDE